MSLHICEHIRLYVSIYKHSHIIVQRQRTPNRGTIINIEKMTKYNKKHVLKYIKPALENMFIFPIGEKNMKKFAFQLKLII